jgi:hypothetical protein
MLPRELALKRSFNDFGSLSEIIDDLKSHSEEEVIQLVQKRWKGVTVVA